MKLKTFQSLPGWTKHSKFFLIFGIAALPGLAEAASTQLDYLADLSLEQLGQIVVTSVSRQPEKLSETASAIQVITGEEIRRSGASTLPEALRLATNLQVSQSNSQNWVITARGFSSDVGNKLLVMIDGRTIYTPLFSGVYWDRQDYLLEDIERIEVISGPGSTLWGSNAVNGVINIITKSTTDTQGLYLEAASGTELRSLTSARYGGSLGSDVNYRVYARYADRDGSALPDGNSVSDAWDRGQLGFRIDATPSSRNSFTLQGDYYQNDAGVATGGDSETKGANILGRWTHQFSRSSDMNLQLYFDRTELTLPVSAMIINGLQFAPAGILRDTLNTFDIDFQHSFYAGDRNKIVWGLAYRNTHDVVENAPSLAFFPEHLDQELYSGFIQDEVALIPDRLFWTLGAQFEHNDYTGWETVPSTRLQWRFEGGHTLWGAVSRAVRTPSRIDRDISQPGPDQPPLFLVVLTGGDNFKSETVVAWEAGYRAMVGDRLSASISVFYNEYNDIRSTSPNPDTFLPFSFENNLEGETHGLEISADYQVTDWWRLRGGYNLLKEDIHVQPGREDFNNALNETADPENQIYIHSSMDVSDDLILDINLRWVDDLIVNNSGVADEVPAYTELDISMGWQLTQNLMLSLIGQNLLDNQHPEFGITSPAREEIERSFYGKLAWRF